MTTEDVLAVQQAGHEFYKAIEARDAEIKRLQAELKAATEAPPEE